MPREVFQAIRASRLAALRAEIAAVCNRAALAAVRRAVAAEIAQAGKGSAQLLIQPADLEAALQEMLGGPGD